MITIGAEITATNTDLRREVREAGREIEGSLAGAFRNVDTVARQIARSVGSGLTAAIRRPLALVTSLRTAIGGVLVGVGLDRLITQSTQLTVNQAALANQLGVSEQQVGRYISRVNDATLGLADFATASEVSNRALLAGIPPERVAELTRYAAVLASARGEADEFASQLPQLFKQLASGETGELKEFGVFIDPKALDGLSLADRRIRVLDLSLDQLRRNAEAVGISGEETAFQYAAISGNIGDAVRSLGVMLTTATATQNVIRNLAELTGNIATGLREDDGASIGKALLVSVAELGPVLIQTITGAIGKAALSGGAFLLRTLAGLDYSGIARSIVAEIGSAIAQAVPALASLLDLDGLNVGGGIGGIARRGADALDRGAAGIEPTAALRQFGRDQLERFGPRPATDDAGNTSGLLAGPRDLGRIDRDDVLQARRNVRSREFRRQAFEDSRARLAEDPELARQTSQPGSAGRRARRAVDRLARQLAAEQIEFERLIANIGRGDRLRLTELADLQQAIRRTPGAEDTLRQRQRDAIRESLPADEREQLDSFIRRANPAPTTIDPLATTRDQIQSRAPGLNLTDASLRELIVAAIGTALGGPAATLATPAPVEPTEAPALSGDAQRPGEAPTPITPSSPAPPRSETGPVRPRGVFQALTTEPPEGREFRIGIDPLVTDGLSRAAAALGGLLGLGGSDAEERGPALDGLLPQGSPTEAPSEFDRRAAERLMPESPRPPAEAAEPAPRERDAPAVSSDPSAPDRATTRMATSGDAAAEALEQGAATLNAVLAAATRLNEALSPIGEQLDEAARALA